MLKEQDIVVVSVVSWHANPGVYKQISLRLARDNRLLFVNPGISLLTPLNMVVHGIRHDVSPYKQFFGNLTILTPRLLPFKNSRFGSRFSNGLKIKQIRAAMSELKFKDPILISGARPELFGSLGEKLSAYLCNDDILSGTSYTGVSHDWLLEKERKTLQNVDLVFVVSQRLLEKKRPNHDNVFCISNGCDASHFERASGGCNDLPPDISKVKRPIIGFMGYINNRIDFNLVYALSTARPDWSFVFIGSPMLGVDQSYLELFDATDNIHLLGFKQKDVLPDYIRAFDVCFIPYVDDEFNRSCSPIKLYEYLATGKPTVSSRIPAVEEFKDIVYIADGKTSFLKQIERALKEDDQELRLARVSVARQNDWDARAIAYGDIIQRFLENKGGD